MQFPQDHCLYVIDDDPSVRKALQRLFHLNKFNSTCFASAEEFLTLEIPEGSVGCLLVDIRMPGMSGLDLQRILVTRRLALPLIFITGYGTVPMSVQAMKYGAFDFIEKPFDVQILLDCVGKALELSCRLAQELMEKEDLSRKISNLTSRERQVLEGIAKGQMNKEIAADLGVVEKTVKVHRASLKAKLEVTSLAELVRLYHKYLDFVDSNEVPSSHPYLYL